MKVNQHLTTVQGSGDVKEKSKKIAHVSGRQCPGGTFWKSLGTTWKQLGNFNTAGLAEGPVCSRPQRLWRTVLNNLFFFSNISLQIMCSWVLVFRTSNILCLIFHNSVILPLNYRAGLWGLASCSFVASCLWKVLVLFCNLGNVLFEQSTSFWTLGPWGSIYFFCTSVCCRPTFTFSQGNLHTFNSLEHLPTASTPALKSSQDQNIFTLK